MGAVIESAVNWAVKIANDNSHGYDQNSRWGPNYDCSSLVISAFEQAGCKVKSGGATYTGNMKSVFLKYGFSDITSKIALSTGLGLKRGDVLLNTVHHTALVVEDNGRTIVNASINEKGKTTGGKSGDQTGREIYTRGYYNYPWNVVLRYNESSSTAASVTTSTKEDKDYSLSDSFGTGGNTVSDKFSASADATYKLIVGGNDITPYVGNLSWQNSIDELATKMSFEVAKSDTNYVNTYAPHIGDIVNFCTNIEIFRGIVIAVDEGDKFKNKYTVTDFGWYLNKSKETYQFNNMNAKKAVIRLCSDFNIPIDSVPELNTSITQIYIDKCISDILSDILDKCGGSYNFDMTPNGIRIYKYGEIYAYPEFRITPNTHLIYSPSLRGNVSHTLSIEDMKNSVKVITETDKVYTVKAVAKDTDSIYKYGVLQDVFKIDEKDGDANTYAKNKLAELNKIKESFSIEIIEAINSYTRAGALITVDNINYLIESADHSIKNGIHYVKLGLRKFG